MILSKPHYLHGDETLRERFDGLNPDEDKERVFSFFLYCHRVLKNFQLEITFLEPQQKHQTALYAEPLTGLILKAAKRLQLSYRFSPGATADVPALTEGGIVPLYIVEQTFEANRKREITSSRLTSKHFITKP